MRRIILIKSNNPHLAGGEIYYIFYIYIYIYYNLYIIYFFS